LTNVFLSCVLIISSMCDHSSRTTRGDLLTENSDNPQFLLPFRDFCMEFFRKMEAFSFCQCLSRHRLFLSAEQRTLPRKSRIFIFHICRFFSLFLSLSFYLSFSLSLSLSLSLFHQYEFHESKLRQCLFCITNT